MTMEISRQKLWHLTLGYYCRLPNQVPGSKTDSNSDKSQFEVNDHVWVRIKSCEPFYPGQIAEDENFEYYRAEDSSYFIK